MDARWLRILYAIEFFAALAAVFLAWPEIGGPAHLDQMDWRWKFGLGFGLAAAAVGATQQMVQGSRLKMALWTVLALLLITGMGAVTYYYHVHEDDQQLEEDIETQRTRA